MRLGRLWPGFGYGRCLRCARPWWRARYHKTPFSAHQALFPLCERCWGRLTIEERLPYYRELFGLWSSRAPGEWHKIEVAVRAGR